MPEVRRVVCTIFARRYVLLIDESKHFLRLVVAMLVSLAYLMLMIRVRPYVRPEDDMLACISQTALVLIFFCGILMETFQSLSDQAGVEAAEASTGFDSTDSIVTMMIMCTIGMFCLSCIVIVVEGIKSYRLAFARSKWACTMETNAPHFEWRAHGDYACFLRCTVCLPRHTTPQHRLVLRCIVAWPPSHIPYTSSERVIAHE
jgi:hypothetical protein